MSWEVAAIIPVSLLPFFFVFLAESFNLPGPLFFGLKLALYLAGLMFLPSVFSIASLIVEKMSGPVGVINALSSLSSATWYLTLSISFFVVIWYSYTTIFNISQGFRGKKGGS